MPHQADSPWAPQCQQKPIVPYPGHSSVLPLEPLPHTAFYGARLLEGRVGLPWLEEPAASGRAALLCCLTSTDIQGIPILQSAHCCQKRNQEESGDGERGLSQEGPCLGFPSLAHPSQGFTPHEIPGRAAKP